VLKRGRGHLLTGLDQPLSPAQQQQYQQLLTRRGLGEPIAYLLGSQGFWSLDLQVTPDVLVPRPETELLVEWALQLFAEQAPCSVADLGTGSGALALAIAAERPHWQVHASDVSEAALSVARGNAERLRLPVQFHHGSWWQAHAARRYQLVLANPPYIPAGDPHLPALRHEPLLALSDGADGLSALRSIIAGAAEHLQAGGWLLLEHGHDQGAAVRDLLAVAGFAEISTRCDLEHRERASGGRRP